MVDVVLYPIFCNISNIYLVFGLFPLKIVSKSLSLLNFDVDFMYFLLIHLKNHVEMSTFVTFLENVISNEVSDE